jgi:hypothetical protein
MLKDIISFFVVKAVCKGIGHRLLLHALCAMLYAKHACVMLGGLTNGSGADIIR